MKKILYICSAALIGLWSCDPEIDTIPTPSNGGADGIDVSKYVAVGNSLTAGFADGALYYEGQVTSFPSILAQQFTEIGAPSAFAQPLMPFGTDGRNGWGNFGGVEIGRLILQPDLEGNLLPTPTQPVDGALDKVDDQGPFNNLGVPGIRTVDVQTAGYGQANPYFNRMTTETNMTYLSMVDASNASFFTNWLGNNDVLGYATSGGLEPLSDPGEFADNYAAIMNAFGSAKGVCITIPDVTEIPYFTFIPWNALVLDAAQAAEANAGYEMMIDPQIQAGVEDQVIKLVSTDTVVKVAVIPDVASGAVYQQAFQDALNQGADTATAMTLAQDFVDSDTGMATIAALEAQLGDELLDHLQGNPTSPELDPLFAIIDNELATNTDLQQAIAATEAQTRQAYDAGLLPELEAEVDAQVAGQKAALQAAGFYPTFEVGPNGFVAEVPVSEINPLGLRQMVAGELILFTANAAGLLTPENAALPKPDQYILISEELEPLNARREELNTIIRSYASNSVGIVEIDPLLQQVNNGIVINGQLINGDYATGGAFSLDAIHLTPRGYSLVANYIIDAVNSKFGSTISPVIVTQFRANEVP